MTRSVDPSTDPDDAWPGLAPDVGWRFLVLAQVCNFNVLRRHIGKARADRLMDDVAMRAAQALPLAAAPRVGRSVLEIDLLGGSLADADAALDALARAFESPLDLDGELHRVDLLVAAAAAPIRAVDEVRLAEEAEEALARAQAGRPGPVRDITDLPRALDRISFTRELTAAIAGDEVFLQYQPKMNLRRHEVSSAEALVRWRHPERGLILPNDFITLAEETGLIGPLTLWTLRRAIADQRTLRADGHDLTLFINISGQLLGDGGFVGEACELVREGGARIGFEITETSMIRDPDCAVRHLERIAKAGVPIAIDDYGSGLSSLAYLKKLPATELKIDKMFVMELTSSHRDPLIVRSTIDLAHAMEMEVTAEGVETPAALALLTVMGCDQVQGFLLSRPLSLDAFRGFLASDAAHRSLAPTFSLDRNGSFWRAA